MGETIAKKLRRLVYSNDWVLFYRLDRKTKSQSFDLSDCIGLYPPPGKIWADPFIYPKDDKYYIFIEEMDNSHKKGYISVLAIDHNGVVEGPRKVLEEPYHLSYPHVFGIEKDLFMIPETKRGRSIRLYRCLDFPHKWKFEKEIIPDIEATDSTLFKHNDTFWLFTSIRRNDGNTDTEELHLYYSDDFFNGIWTPHPKNPVIEDPTHSRPAGNIFSLNGSLIRPTQYFIDGFAYGMKMCRIDELNKNNYRETVIRTLEPDNDKKQMGIHTYNFSEGLTVIDARIKRRKFFPNG